MNVLACGKLHGSMPGSMRCLSIIKAVALAAVASLAVYHAVISGGMAGLRIGADSHSDLLAGLSRRLESEVQSAVVLMDSSEVQLKMVDGYCVKAAGPFVTPLVPAFASQLGLWSASTMHLLCLSSSWNTGRASAKTEVQFVASPAKSLDGDERGQFGFGRGVFILVEVSLRPELATTALWPLQVRKSVKTRLVNRDPDLLAIRPHMFLAIDLTRSPLSLYGSCWLWILNLQIEHPIVTRVMFVPSGRDEVSTFVDSPRFDLTPQVLRGSFAVFVLGMKGSLHVHSDFDGHKETDSSGMMSNPCQSGLCFRAFDIYPPAVIKVGLDLQIQDFVCWVCWTVCPCARRCAGVLGGVPGVPAGVLGSVPAGVLGSVPGVPGVPGVRVFKYKYTYKYKYRSWRLAGGSRSLKVAGAVLTQDRLAFGNHRSNSHAANPIQLDHPSTALEELVKELRAQLADLPWLAVRSDAGGSANRAYSGDAVAARRCQVAGGNGGRSECSSSAQDPDLRIAGGSSWSSQAPQPPLLRDMDIGTNEVGRHEVNPPLPGAVVSLHAAVAGERQNGYVLHDESGEEANPSSSHVEDSGTPTKSDAAQRLRAFGQLSAVREVFSPGPDDGEANVPGHDEQHIIGCADAATMKDSAEVRSSSPIRRHVTNLLDTLNQEPDPPEVFSQNSVLQKWSVRKGAISGYHLSIYETPYPKEEDWAQIDSFFVVGDYGTAHGHNIKRLQSLELLLKCLVASVNMLCWSFILLFAIQCIAGMIIANLVRDYISDESNHRETRRALFIYYGTFTRTFLTMFEIIFANWAPACRVLVDNVSEWFSNFFLVYRCDLGFALVNVLNTVFVQQTLRAASIDEELSFKQKQKDQVKYTQELELEYHDLLGLFEMLDDCDEEVSLDEFVEGAGRLKGTARTIDLWRLETNYIKRIRDSSTSPGQ
ncbi:unnamed protein product [Polarella glacialis]|uniref:Uncharacterized protein n=2 Tax=Polarella glacialis TaxID=89957 RepID=A0A813JDF6_POLGL|nr:unnamed protein product [Polarella glacialis]